MTDWILMIKGDEEKLVHPGNVDNHLRAGWKLAKPSTQGDPSASPDEQQTVAVETPATEELAHESDTSLPEESSEEPLAFTSEDPS